MIKNNCYLLVGISLVFVATLVGCEAGPNDEAFEGNSVASTQQLSARKAFKKQTPQRPKTKHRLVAKFRDDLNARVDSNGIVRSKTARAVASSDTVGVSELAERVGVRFSQRIPVSESSLEKLRTRAEQTSRQKQPDLAGIMVVDAPDEKLQEVADELNASPLTEFVYFESVTPVPPPQACSDIAPPTPNYVSQQGYAGPNPGVNMAAAWALGSARGAGIKIADCEYGYNENHEDLCGVIPEPGQTIDPAVVKNGWDQHGTGVLGVLGSKDNAFGSTGLVPDAQLYFFSEQTVQRGFDFVAAVANAITSMRAGDIVMLEMQAIVNGNDRMLAPVEFEPAVWQLVKSATAAGIIVVAAAGNGAQDLDGPIYEEYRSRGDSGAIIVGAGSADIAHSPLSFSTYGSRVNLQGWGQNVFTTGGGDYATIGGDKNQQYTAGFNGTSSATPIVAGSVAAVQSYAESALNRRLSPLEMRNLLIATGTPQGSGVHIGPLPNVAKAIQQLSGQSVACGDGVCNGTETCQSCSSDCGVCPSCVPQGCESVTHVKTPYAANGPLNTCVFFTDPTSYINSWVMDKVELNGVKVTNAWIGSSAYPATCNGGYYLRSVGNYPWSHVEAK
jgi:hypothetical protein